MIEYADLSFPFSHSCCGRSSERHKGQKRETREKKTRKDVGSLALVRLTDPVPWTLGA